MEAPGELTACSLTVQILTATLGAEEGSQTVVIRASLGLATVEASHVGLQERRTKSLDGGHKARKLPVDNASDIIVGVDKDVIALVIDMA